MQIVWTELNHDTIFAAVEKACGVKLSNVLQQRNSYINRVYEVEEEKSRERLIVKFYRPGRWTMAQINEEHQFLQELAAKESPVIPPLKYDDQTLFQFNSIPYALFPKKGGRALDEFGQTGWETIGRILARIHLISQEHESSTRITWRPAIATRHHLTVLQQSAYVLPDFLPALTRATENFIKKADPLFNQDDFILLHGDLHKGNLIHRPGEGVFVVDFDDLCFGPAVQDVWMLLPGGVEQSANELAWLRKGYETFRPFNSQALTLIPALRGMRLIHFAAWQAIQCQEPDFDRHFPDAGKARYWNELVNELDDLL
jgi:Ser/Thr protein kinase RdoA (MazF antagonist)